MNEWFENEEFWKETYPYLFSAERFEAADEQVEKTLALTSTTQGKVLDLCCGPGRFTLPLAARGFEMTGVDRTVFLLDKAKQRAAEQGATVEWVEADMRDFVRPNAFDLVTNMFTSFGFFDDRSQDVKVLANIYESLKPGGKVVLDMMGKERIARIFQPSGVEFYEDGTMFVSKRELFDGFSRTRNEWILVKDGKTKSFSFHHTIYSGRELKDRLEQVGFPDVKLYGDFDGNEYGLEALRLIAVATK